MKYRDNQVLGEVIRVDGINTYLVKTPPEPPVEAGAGDFVGVESAEGLSVGVITGIQRIIPEELTSLISLEHESKYLPYNTDFKSNYYTALSLGVITPGGVKHQVHIAPHLRHPVTLLSRDTIRQFHLRDGVPSISYLQRYRHMLSEDVLLRILEEVEEILPECSRMLHLIKKHLLESDTL